MSDRLSKSRLLSLRQCPLRLWHEIHSREQAITPGEVMERRFAEGTRVGELAQQRYPGGVLIDEPFYASDEAQQHTLAVIQSDPAAIFEAAFEASRTRIRVDIMLRIGAESWEVWEVKAVGTAKEIHFIDLALQLRIIEDWAQANQLPLPISRCGILHLNTAYNYPGGVLDLGELFSEHDCTDTIGQYDAEVDRLLESGLSLLDMSIPPATAPGAQCSDPYPCPFSGSSCPLPPEEELCQLPGIGASRAAALRAQDISTLQEAARQPELFNNRQQRALSTLEMNQPIIEQELKEELSAIGLPRHYLDFETTGSMLVLPHFPDTHPFQALPFQFSLHTELTKGGELLHQGYLHTTGDDPRRPFIEKLLAMLEAVPGKIIVYSPYEQRILNELKQQLPEYALRIDLIIKRLVDLLPIIRENVYHPDFHGSFSIKAVLPALVPGSGYSDLEIQDGDTASLRYLQMLGVVAVEKHNTATKCEEVNVNSIHTALWNYCKQDTRAMVDLVHKLED